MELKNVMELVNDAMKNYAKEFTIIIPETKEVISSHIDEWSVSNVFPVTPSGYVGYNANNNCFIEDTLLRNLKTRNDLIPEWICETIINILTIYKYKLHKTER